MPKNKQDDKIEPIEDSFDNVTKAVIGGGAEKKNSNCSI